MSNVKILKNYINGKWVSSQTLEFEEVYNPANGEVIAKVPISTRKELDEAVEVAQEAFSRWSKISILKRSKYFFRLQNILENNKDELAKLITLENGKTLTDAFGEVGRGIENVEHAAGIVNLMMGDTVANVATDVEVSSYKYPIGVIGAITPFNFPMMVPFWMFPMAIASGNTVVLKPSEKTPLLVEKIIELTELAGFPKGILNVVYGSNEVVNGILQNPIIKAVSFVGSEPVGRYVYQEGTKHRKRVQALTGAKNHTLVLSDANIDDALPKIIGGVFGSAGQRCMAASVLLIEDDIYDIFMDRFVQKAKEIVIGDGMDDTTFLGPVIRKENQKRTFEYIEKGIEEGAKISLDGRENIPEHGFFVGPTIFEEVKVEMEIWKNEVFAPLVSVFRVKDLKEAISISNKHELANGACLFTNDSRAIRYFRENIDAGMLGVNLGVPAPIAWFPFSGAKDSFYGDLHVNGKDGVNFYTKNKVVTAQYNTEKLNS